MTTEIDTKPVEQIEEKKEDDKEEIKKEEAEAQETEEKADDKAEKTDKEACDKKDEDKKEVKVKKEPAPPKPSVHKQDFEKDVVYLYQFTRTPVLPSLSPYCLKVETWLRLAGIKYENVDHKMKFKSKKGQLPFVEVNGEEIADSAIIMKDLSVRYNADLDAGLTAEQRNVAHTTVSMIENHFVWVLKALACNDSDIITKGLRLDLKQMTGYSLPSFIIKWLFRRNLKAAAKKVRAHGIGVHNPEEIEEFGHGDLKVLSDLLGDKPYFFGDEPSTLDVVSFANLAQVAFMDKEVTYSLRDWMTENCSNLVDFCNRMKEKAFPDWEEMCTNLDLNSHIPKPVPEPEEKEEKKEEKKDEKEGKEDKKDEKEKDDSEKEKAQKDEKEGEKGDNKEDNKTVEEKEKEK